jgi:predicted  nucleic acid-binding Zn-ribbon protein
MIREELEAELEDLRAQELTLTQEIEALRTDVNNAEEDLCAIESKIDLVLDKLDDLDDE